MINLGTNPRPFPWPVDGRLGDPDPARRAERLRTARLAIEHSGPFVYEVVDLDHGPSAAAAPGAGPRSSRISTPICARPPEA